MQNEPRIPRRCSIFPGRAPHPPRPSRRWGAGAALVALAAVLGIATPEDARAQTVTVPVAPQQFRVSTNDARRALLRWTVPDDGGAPITAYEYRYAAGDTVPESTMWTSQVQDPPDDTDALMGSSRLRGAVVTGLTIGTQYAFEVRAVNSEGESAAATQTATVPRPLIELSWDAREAWLGPFFTLTITFSEAVTGFTLNDLSMQTNSLSDGTGHQSSVETANFQEILAKTTYSVEVTPVPHIHQQARAVSVLIDNAAVHTVNGETPNEQKSQLIDLILPVTGTEREALAALYTATGGANWTSNDNWLDDDMELGDWHGVTTNDDGEVTQLTLRGNELSGSLPAKLGNLVPPQLGEPHASVSPPKYPARRDSAGVGEPGEPHASVSPPKYPERRDSAGVGRLG